MPVFFIVMPYKKTAGEMGHPAQLMVVFVYLIIERYTKKLSPGK
jgi:hypothetical protein